MNKELIKEYQKIPGVAPTNPALMVGTSTTILITAVYMIFSYFIPGVPEEVIDAVATVAVFIVPIVVSWIIRGKVWSPNSVQEIVREAIAAEQRLLAAPSDSPKMTQEEIIDFKKKFFTDNQG